MYKILFLLLFPVITFSQTTNNFSDTTIIVGVILEDSYVGKDISSYCSNGFDKNLVAGTGVIVCGTESCKKSYSNESTDFYEITVNKNTYFIQKEKIILGEAISFEWISNLLPEQKNTLREHSINISEIIYYNEGKKALAFLDKCKPAGLVSVKIKVYNPTKKIIKYLWFSFVGYNPVGDKVIDRKKGTSVMSAKGVGPIEPDASGTYEYSYVWFTDLVEKASITSIKVQYMDGTFKTIANPKSIMLSDKQYELIFGDE